MAAPLRLELLLEAVDRISGPLGRVQGRISGLAEPIRRIGAATAALGRAPGLDRLASSLTLVGQAAAATAGRLAVLGGAAGLGGIAAFNLAFIRPAADMENLAIQLETALRSASAAREALGWITRFAEETPMEVGQVSRAFVHLRTAGIDPTAGALRAAGDAASAFAGGNLEQAVGALTGALRGQLPPLERFGVQARIVGDRMVIEWEAQGRRFRATVDKNNRALIAARITRAWNDVAGGGMARMSRSWDGMMASLRNTWTRFTTAVMDAGLFDFLKSRLEALLGVTNRMRADGSMQSWAEATSTALIQAFQATERFLFGWSEVAEGMEVGQPGVVTRISDAFRGLSDAFRTFQGVIRPVVGDVSALEIAMVALAAITFAPLITALTLLGGGLLTTPAGLAVTAIGAIALAGVAIYRNWDGVAEWLGRQFDKIKEFGESSLRSLIDGPLNTFQAFAGSLRRAWEGIEGFFSGLFEGIERRARAVADAVRSLIDLLPGGAGSPGNDPDAQRRRRENFGRRGELSGLLGPPIAAEPMGFFGPPTGALSTRPGAGRGDRVNVGGEVRVTVDDRRVQVATRPDSRDVEWSVFDRGLSMRGA